MPIAEAIPMNFLISDSSTPAVIVDSDMCIVSHSQTWLSESDISDKNVVGKSYYDVMTDIPSELIIFFEESLKGKSYFNKGQKFIYPNGRLQWLKWNITPWRLNDHAIGGLILVIEDITEQKRTEELLMKAEEVARIGGWEIDLVTNKMYWTRITKEIHEVTNDYIPNLEEGINFYKAGEHRENITYLVSEAISNGTPWDTELIIVTAKGKELWVRAKGETEMHNGQCVRIYGTFQDIDTAKRSVEKYKETTERLHIATKGAKIGIWDFEVSSNKLYWDENMYALYGIEKNDFTGDFDAWKSVIHPDDIERCDKESDLAISGKKEYNTEFRIIWPNGEIRHIKAIAVIQRDINGKVVKIIGTNWDITELKNTQLRLVKTEESLQGTFENSSIGMALVGTDGKFIKVNESLCKITGYNREELLELTFMDITHVDDLSTDMNFLQEIIEGEHESYQLDKRYYHKKGHIVHVLLTVTVAKTINGEISHFISQLVDLSSRMEAEKKLKTLFKVTNEQNKSLMNFAHIVSHNLRSHATNFSMLTNFLQKEEDEEERKNLTNMLKDASENLQETIMHLNDVVQVKTKALEKMKSVNLYKSIRAIEKNISVLMREKNAKCAIHVPENQKIQAIPAYLDSILLNLFTNSLKYSSPDRKPIIEIRTNETDNNVVLLFKDNGLGIDLDRHRSKLFGMYKTFHKHKDAKGIGLFITKNQVESMNATIDVESTVDVGTTFKLYFEKS